MSGVRWTHLFPKEAYLLNGWYALQSMRHALYATASHRAVDVALQQQEDNYHTSIYYLLELTQREPTVMQAMHTLQSHLLNGFIHVKIDGRPASLRFQQFVNKYYVRFCEESIFAMMTYGFIPWYIRKLKNGNMVPTVLPPGSFTWHVRPVAQMKKEFMRTCDMGKLLLYDITLQTGVSDIDRKDVYIYEFETPVWEVGRYTINASVSSPLQNLVTTYRRLLTAMQNRAHADLWNSQAHIITKQAAQGATQEPTATMFEAGRQVGAMYSYEDCKIQLFTRDADIQEQFTSKESLHVPYVYTLPLNVSTEQAPVLRPCEDVQMLWDKFSRDVAMCFSLPPEALGIGSGGSDRTTLHLHQHETLFNSMLSRFRRHLQFAMQDAYREIYLRGKEEKGRLAEQVEFVLVNNTSLRLNSVEELAKLAAVEGALPPGMLHELVQRLVYGNAGVAQVAAQYGKASSESSGVANGAARAASGQDGDAGSKDTRKRKSDEASAMLTAANKLAKKA